MRSLIRTRLAALRRARAEDGFGLIELLISLIILSVAISGLFLVFSSASLSIARAGQSGTATVIVDRVLEYYRRTPWANIRLLKASLTGAPALYASQCTNCPVGASSVDVDEDAASAPYNDANNTATCNLGSTSQDADEDTTAPITKCEAVHAVTGADGNPYLVYTYMRYGYFTGTTNVDTSTKVVTIIVRAKNTDTSPGDRILAETTSTFNFQSYTTCAGC